MRFLIVAIILATVLLAGPAFAVETRCGLSAGAVIGVSVPYFPVVHDEFDYLIRFEANVKYYLVWGLAISGGTGYQYGEGVPTKIWLDDKMVELDARGTSFWRGWPLFADLRLEFWRYGIFNPYIGGGGGVTYLQVYRKGYELNQPKSNSGEEWVPQYYGLVGFDIAITKYIAIRVDGKYRVLRTVGAFFEQMDYGGVDVMAGLNIYF